MKWLRDYILRALLHDDRNDSDGDTIWGKDGRGCIAAGYYRNSVLVGWFVILLK